MPDKQSAPLQLHADIERWALKVPFRITGFTWEALEVLVVSLRGEGHTGRAEAAGVYYRRDTPQRMLEQIEAVRAQIERGVTREALQRLLPPGGARNALDCALWDLEAKLDARPVWRIAGLSAEPAPLLTTFTCGADTPEQMAATAQTYSANSGARAIKLKLTGDASDAERVRAVRAAVPTAWIGVDANQGFTRASLEQLLPTFVDARVALIEQPFPIGQEAQLDGLASPIPIAADESAQSLSDIESLTGRFQVMNIKLDKCGGLTEALAMARRGKALGLDIMVGNMLGTSLAMAPAYLVGQLCKVVDLDGPVFLKSDRSPSVRYEHGKIRCAPDLWG